jgi:hypothetical protein
MHTNADVVAGEYPIEFLEIANLQLSPQRNKKLLSDQFMLRWQFEPVTVSGVWTFSIHNRIAFSGITSETPGEIFESEREIFGPLSPCT